MDIWVRTTTLTLVNRTTLLLTICPSSRLIVRHSPPLLNLKPNQRTITIEASMVLSLANTIRIRLDINLNKTTKSLLITRRATVIKATTISLAKTLTTAKEVTTRPSRITTPATTDTRRRLLPTSLLLKPALASPQAHRLVSIQTSQ
jgi:hypothetical protein